MSELDPKLRFSMAVLAKHAPDQGIAQVGAFLAGKDYQMNILPLFSVVEAHLKESWQRFNTSAISPLLLQNLSEPCALPVAAVQEGSLAMPAVNALESDSVVQMASGEESGVQEELKQASSFSLDFEISVHSPGAASDAAPVILATPPSSLATEATSGAQVRPGPTLNDQVSPSPTPVSAGPAPQPAQRGIPVKLEFKLPNASVGQAYTHELLPMNPVAGVVVKDVLEADKLGLSFDSSSGCLIGMPTQAGDFQVEIRCFANNTLLDLVSARLIVNPDPKSLWKNLPSNQSDPYWKPDEDHQFISSADGWSLVAGSKRGRSHAQNGTFRDDDFFIYSQKESGWQIAVVSDGAGSAKFSRRGSAIICKEGGEHLEHALRGEAGSELTAAVEAWQSSEPQGADDQKRLIKKQLYVTLGYAAHFALTKIREECEQRSALGGTVKDYSSTILIGIVKRFPFGIFCGSFSIGDGAIGVMHTDGSPELLCEPDGGDFSGQTRFLSQDTVTQEELLKRLKFSLVPDFAGMYLMTDGISDPYFQTDKGLEMPERWAQLIQDIETEASLTQRAPDSGQRLVSWLDFWSKGEHDDRTLAVIY